MGVWDELDKLKKRAQKEVADRAAKAAVEKSREAAVSAFASAKKKIGDALFGEEDAEPSSELPGGDERRSKEDAAGRKLREAAARQADRVTTDRTRAEREAREAEAREARARASAEAERQIDDELAALKKKIGK